MPPFGIKDIIDVVLMALLLYYIYRLMKESGTINIFYGIMAFIVVWVVASEIFAMRLIGTILDKFMNIGLLILVILFQDQIKRFLVELGSHRGLRFLAKLFHHKNNGQDAETAWIMPVVHACMNLSKTKTGALIVVERTMPLDSYEETGDIINADVNSRLVENLFFKNSPLHDGALIISKGRLSSAGCILPVSHDNNLPRYMGLRHRSALGIAQATDAIAIVVSEETGKISIAYRGKISSKLSSAELEQQLSSIVTSPTA